MIPADKLEEFLKELSDLCLLKGIVIGGCGCCGSPFLGELPRDKIIVNFHYRLRPNNEQLEAVWVEPTVEEMRVAFPPPPPPPPKPPFDPAVAHVKPGEIYQSPRGRCYKVLRVDNERRVILLDTQTGKEDSAVWPLMVPENGWHLIPEAS